MPTNPESDPKRFQCRHIHANGRRCGSPALRHENFCYYHHATRRPAPKPGAPRYPDAEQHPFALPPVEDRPSLQLALNFILSRIASNDLDPKRAGLLLYGLQIAAISLPREPRSTAGSTCEYGHPCVPDPASNSNQTSDILDHIAIDPDLGPLAPIAEILPRDPNEDTEDTSDSLFEKYLTHIRESRPICPLCNPATPEDPATNPAATKPIPKEIPEFDMSTLPKIQACAEPRCRTPHPKSRTRTHPQKPSSRPKAAHFAAAVERPPHFAVAVAVAVACSFACHPVRTRFLPGAPPQAVSPPEVGM